VAFSTTARDFWTPARKPGSAGVVAKIQDGNASKLGGALAFHCVLLFGTACTRTGAIEPEPAKVHASSSASRSAAASNASGANVSPSKDEQAPAPLPARASAEPDVIELQFEITQDSAAEQTLWVNVPSLHVRQAMGHSKAPFVCGVVSSLVEPYDYDEVYPPKETTTHCGEGKRGWVRILEETLILSDLRIPVGPAPKLDHRAIRQPFPSANDCRHARPQRIQVSIVRDERELKLVIPELGVNHLIKKMAWGMDWDCWTKPITDDSQLEYVCSHSPMSRARSRLYVERDILFFENRFEADFEHVITRERFGIQLPCNAQLQLSGFRPFHIPAESQCEKRCQSNDDGCRLRCVQRGHPRNCADDCYQKESACVSHCRGGE